MVSLQLVCFVLDLPEVLEQSHLRNVQQEPEDQSSPPSPLLQPTKTCPGPHPLIYPSIPSSIHLSGCGGTDTSFCQDKSSLTRAPVRAFQGPCWILQCPADSVLMLDKVRRVGAVPSVSIMEERRCSAVVFLRYSKGDPV